MYRRASMRPLCRLSILLLALFAFCAAPIFPTRGAQYFPAEWIAPIRALAEKIASAAGAPGPLAMNMTNNSSLGSPDASAIYEDLLTELRARHYQIVSPVPSTASGVRVQITFSEDAARYLLVAQVWTAPNTDAQVAIGYAPKIDRNAGKPPAAVVLNRKLIYSQPERILDFALLDDPGSLAPGRSLVVVEPERIAFLGVTGNQWQAGGAARISHAGPWPRDLAGAIDPVSGKITINGTACRGDALHPETLQCEIPRRASASISATNQIQSQLPEHAGEAISLTGPCPAPGGILLATGDGDWTQADHLQAFDAASQPAVAIGQPYQLAGPVLALGAAADGKSARVVSLNLQTGMYEASIVSLSCGN